MNLRLLAFLAVISLTAGCSLLGKERSERAVAVEVVELRHGRLAAHRTLSGTLESPSRIVVATRTSGRIASLDAALDGTVRRGQVIATLDRGEYEQAVLQARAALAMAKARATESELASELAKAEAHRAATLHGKGATSDSARDRDTAEAALAAAGAKVAQAAVLEARAAATAAEARLSEATLTATWTGEDDERVVAARYHDAGTVVAAGTPLVELVDLDPLRAVVQVTDRDVAKLHPGQPVHITSEASPEVRFDGVISRIAPVFDPSSRQARVEIDVPNADRALRPGQFIRAVVELDHVQDAIIVPEDAVVRRNDHDVVFLIAPGADVARLVPVQVGLRDAGQAQVTGEGLEGQVVVLGQQRLGDGAKVSISAQGKP